MIKSLILIILLLVNRGSKPEVTQPFLSGSLFICTAASRQLVTPVRPTVKAKVQLITLMLAVFHSSVRVCCMFLTGLSAVQ